MERGVEVDRGTAEAGIARLGVDLGIGSGLEHQPAIDREVLGIIDGLPGCQKVAVEPVGGAVVTRQHEPRASAKRTGDVGGCLDRVLLGVRDLGGAFETIARLERGQHQRARRSVAPIERALRAFEDFDLAQRALDLVQLRGVGLEDAVDHQRDRAFRITRAIDPADVDLGIARFGGAGDDRHAGGELGEIGSAVGARSLERGCGQHCDRGGNVLEALLLTAGRDDDRAVVVGRGGFRSWIRRLRERGLGRREHGEQRYGRSEPGGGVHRRNPSFVMAGPAGFPARPVVFLQLQISGFSPLM